MGKQGNPGERKVAKYNEIVLLQTESLVSSSKKEANFLMKRICCLGANDEFALVEQFLSLRQDPILKGFIVQKTRNNYICLCS